MNNQINKLNIQNFLSIEDFNSLLNKINLYTKEDQFPGWKFSGYSNENQTNKPFWYLNVCDDAYFNTFLFGKIKQCVKVLTNENINYSKIYLNGSTFGNQGYFHTDGLDNHRTFLIYCNDEWKEEWGGATVFKINDTIENVYPYPRNAVYFDATIPHFSQPLSRDFYDLRVTLAYKLYLDN